jgi:hypothetical protein
MSAEAGRPKLYYAIVGMGLAAGGCGGLRDSARGTLDATANGSSSDGATSRDAGSPVDAADATEGDAAVESDVTSDAESDVASDVAMEMPWPIPVK